MFSLSLSPSFGKLSNASTAPWIYVLPYEGQGTDLQDGQSSDTFPSLAGNEYCRGSTYMRLHMTYQTCQIPEKHNLPLYQVHGPGAAAWAETEHRSLRRGTKMTD